MRVLVTRPQPGAAQTGERLRKRGHEALLSPVSLLRPIAAPPPSGVFNAVIVSSANALRALTPAMQEHIRSLPVFTVGTATAQVACALGLSATAGPGTAEQLPQTIARRFASPSRLLYLAGEPRKPMLEQALTAAGFNLSVYLSYTMTAADALAAPARAALAAGAVDAILHFSKESAARFVALAEGAGCVQAARNVRHLCMSADVAAGLTSLEAARVGLADHPTEAALLDLLDKDD